MLVYAFLEEICNFLLCYKYLLIPKNNCFGDFVKLDLYSAIALPRPPIILCSSTETISLELQGLFYCHFINRFYCMHIYYLARYIL